MSEPIITFKDRTLRVEHDGWYLEVKVLAAGTQIAVTSNGTSDGSSDMIIHPGRNGLVFISSRASERKTESTVQEQRCGDCMQIIDSDKPHTCTAQVAKNRRGNKS